MPVLLLLQLDQNETCRAVGGWLLMSIWCESLLPSLSLTLCLGLFPSLPVSLALPLFFSSLTVSQSPSLYLSLSPRIYSLPFNKLYWHDRSYRNSVAKTHRVDRCKTTSRLIQTIFLTLALSFMLFCFFITLSISLFTHSIYHFIPHFLLSCLQYCVTIFLPFSQPIFSLPIIFIWFWPVQ